MSRSKPENRTSNLLYRTLEVLQTHYNTHAESINDDLEDKERDYRIPQVDAAHINLRAQVPQMPPEHPEIRVVSGQILQENLAINGGGRTARAEHSINVVGVLHVDHIDVSEGADVESALVLACHDMASAVQRCLTAPSPDGIMGKYGVGGAKSAVGSTRIVDVDHEDKDIVVAMAFIATFIIEQDARF